MTKNRKLIEAIKNCRNMWKWLKENPTKDKNDWPELSKFNNYILNHCFACDYAFSITNDSNTMCKECFLKDTWKQLDTDNVLDNVNKFMCECISYSPYHRWEFVRNLLEKVSIKSNKNLIYKMLLKEKSYYASEIEAGCNILLQKYK